MRWTAKSFGLPSPLDWPDPFGGRIVGTSLDPG